MDKPAIHHAIVREIYQALEKLGAPYSCSPQSDRGATPLTTLKRSSC